MVERVEGGRKGRKAGISVEISERQYAISYVRR